MREFSIANTYHNLTLIPRFGPCYDFIKDTLRAKRSICIVPHVIKHRDDSEVITWRCSLGQVCESDYLYAMAKEKTFPELSSLTVPVQL
jgi:hypothetical protein